MRPSDPTLCRQQKCEILKSQFRRFCAGIRYNKAMAFASCAWFGEKAAASGNGRPQGVCLHVGRNEPRNSATDRIRKIVSVQKYRSVVLYRIRLCSAPKRVFYNFLSSDFPPLSPLPNTIPKPQMLASRRTHLINISYRRAAWPVRPLARRCDLREKTFEIETRSPKTASSAHAQFYIQTDNGQRGTGLPALWATH